MAANVDVVACSCLCRFIITRKIELPSLSQNVRQQSSTELDEMKVGVEELTQQIAQADTAIEEIAASVAELEQRNARVNTYIHA